MEWLPYRLAYYALFVIIVFYFYQIFDIQYVRRFPQSKWVYRSIMVVCPVVWTVFGCVESLMFLKTPVFIGSILILGETLYEGGSRLDRFGTTVALFVYLLLLDVGATVIIFLTQQIMPLPFDPFMISGRDLTIRLGYNAILDIMLLLMTIRLFEKILFRRSRSIGWLPKTGTAKLNALLIIMVVIQIIPMTYLVYLAFLSRQVILFFLALVICTAVQFYLMFIFESLAKRCKAEQDMELGRLTAQMQGEYLEAITRQNDHLQSLIHDMKNHMQVMESLYRLGDREEAEAYMARIIGEMDAEGLSAGSQIQDPSDTSKTIKKTPDSDKNTGISDMQISK